MSAPAHTTVSPPDHDICISVRGVTRAFGKRVVLENVDLAVRRGEIFGLLGPSGAGKTTLVRLICGLDLPNRGEIRLLGVPMPRLDMFGRIGYMAQSDALYNELTARENLTFFASLYGMRGAALKQRIAGLAELLRLRDDLNKPVHQYSGGMKRRLSLAIALVHEPEVLVLDEPTVGIDPELRASIWEELRRLSARGVTVLVTTHVMDEAEKCDRLAMIRDGGIIACGTPDELKRAADGQSMEEAFLHFGGAAS